MGQEDLPEFRKHLDEWAEELELLRQNPLFTEPSFISFARDRGLPVWGLIEGEPGDFYRRGWLSADSNDCEGRPLFHAFRLYPLSQILQRSRTIGLSEEQIKEAACRANQIVALSILVEPIYWPKLCGHVTRRGCSEQDFKSLLRKYRIKALAIVRTLDPDCWREMHKHLRQDADRMDRNADLYLLLRLSHWDRRKDLKGTLSGALWIRHIAEVLRRAFEEVHGQKWPEEDQASGHWRPGGRQRLYGSERPLADVFRSRPYLAYRYGLFTGSAVRWYVEGSTEYYAIVETIGEPHKFGIELWNLEGAIKQEKGNTAVKLENMLKEDKAHRRFSIISLDYDLPTNKLPPNVKVIRRQIEEHNVVGSIDMQRPDFEFHNFTIQELIEVAAQVYESSDQSGSTIREANWNGISCSKQFEAKYKKISYLSLKGEKWGRALARFAQEHQQRPDTMVVRPFLLQVRAALYGWNSNYDFQEENFTFDLESFEPIAKSLSPKVIGENTRE